MKTPPAAVNLSFLPLHESDSCQASESTFRLFGTKRDPQRIIAKHNLTQSYLNVTLSFSSRRSSFLNSRYCS